MTSHPKSTWREPLLVSIAIFVWLAATAGLRPLMLPDEGRYVGVAWEMLYSGNWLTPTLDGLPFFHKPPLFYWISTASMSLFGANAWAARAASLLGAWLGAFALYLFTQRWAGKRAARLTVLALLAEPMFFVGGQFANLDMLVAGCITATVLAAADTLLRMEQKLPFRRSLVAAYAMAGPGVLAKGLIGAVIPGMVIVAWLLVTQRWRRLAALIWVPGLLVFIAVAAPWFIAMQLRFGDFFHYFFVVQHFQRFVGSGFNNVQPIWFYPVVLLLFHLPWTPWLYRIFTPGYWRVSKSEPVRVLMWVWFFAVLVFFSLPKSKLLGYVLPALPPLAYLLVDSLSALQAESPRRLRLWYICTGVAAAIGLGAVAWLTIHPVRNTRDIAVALQSHRQPGEPVFMLNHFYYDVPFYARISEPITVVDDWTGSDVYTVDNWKKELADAGQFAPAQASQTLMGAAQLPAALCRTQTSWVIGPAGSEEHYDMLDTAHAVLTQQGVTLWKMDVRQSTLSNGLRWKELCTSKTQQ